MNDDLHVNAHFKLPIYYNDSKIDINPTIIKDLEMIDTVDSALPSMYTFCFDNDNDISLEINKQIANYYTTDVAFLKDSQKLIKEYNPLEVKYTDYSKNYKNVIDIWKELKCSIGFKEKYYYVESEILEILNRSEFFLQMMSIYSLLSPLLSLMVPILILIIPFVIIKMKGISITIKEYISVLKEVASQNAIGKLCVVNFGEINLQEKLYIFVSAFFYGFSIYQQFMTFVRFNNNMKTIHAHFKELTIYLDHTICSMKNYLTHSKNLPTYASFNSKLQDNLNALLDLHTKIKHIRDYNLFNINSMKEIGKVFKYFYELHTDQIYSDVLVYSLGFNGYLDCLKGLQTNIIDKKMNFASFVDKSKKNVFENSYYASLKNSSPVKNTIQFKRNMIITGPNASGKTTILKSTLINILLSQQFGCGFYDSAKLKPYDKIHCYLNIPDTSARDSLFQAEARRCKEILDSIGENTNETHFCGFDELYSGTNPDEAEKSAISFMKYISKYKSVSFMLTTHFIKVCKKLDKLNEIENYRMISDKLDNTLVYKYILEKGISEIKGGAMVLKQLNYPKEIVDNA
jgi:hypothetical protein